ncbi:MAG: hypothetical protein A4E64_03125 [Syntrophorhabdus sp. PtaU1.Bin058]|nr:MAG: hypothetical protein A4E64_03125 [Syntrophorhabdus sp. PtaU1.Bin058]
MKKGMENLNKMPVNQKAKRMLQKAGGGIGNDSLYCVQLARWAIDNGHVMVEHDVDETIKAMMTWRPARVMNFFMVAAGEEYDPDGWERTRDQYEMALLIIEDIEEKMVAHFPWYRSAE